MWCCDQDVKVVPDATFTIGRGAGAVFWEMYLRDVFSDGE